MTATTLNTALGKVPTNRSVPPPLTSPAPLTPQDSECANSEAVSVPENREFDSSVPGLVELILKDRPQLERLIRDMNRQTTLVSRLLLISFCSFLLFGVAFAVILDSAGVWPQLTALSDVFSAADEGRTVPCLKLASDENRTSRWLEGSALTMLSAYSLGLIAATGICLPSLYFYGLLAGVRMSMRDVVLHALKAKATGAIALIGILPVYAAIAIGIVILNGSASATGPGVLLTAVLWLGLLLPFVGGLFGTWSMYRGFMRLANTLPLDRQTDRKCFLNRLALSWIGVYTAITPVMIFTLWEFFGRVV